MGTKYVSDAVMDAALSKTATGVLLCVCSTYPTTYAEATSTYCLADAVLTPGDGNSFTLADGALSGRRVSVGQQTNVPIDKGTDGTAEHIAVVDGSAILVVTTCTPQVLTAGGTVTVPSFDHEIADVTQ